MNAFPWGELAGEMAAAAVGTAAFSVLFSVPKKYYGLCAACGAIGWLVYFCFHWDGLSPAESTFFSAAAVIFLSRLFCGLGALSGYPVYDSRYFPYCSRSRHLLDRPLHCHRPAGAGKPHGI